MTASIIEDKRQWDEFIDKSHCGMLFHKWDFLKIAEKHTGYRLYPFGLFKSSELMAVFPFFVTKHRGIVKAYSPPPRCEIPHMGPITSRLFDSIKQQKKEYYWKLMMEDLEGEFARLGASEFNFRLAPGVIDFRHFIWRGYRENIRYTYTIDLKRPLEEIWKSFDIKTRQYIHKVSLSIGQSDDVGLFYRIMSERYNEQNLKFRDILVSEQYLGDLLKAYPENLKLSFFSDEGIIKGVVLDYIYKGHFMEWMGGVNLDKSMHVNEFARWHFIKEAKALGCHTYEIAGADNMRLCPYKSKFNPDLCCYYTLYKKPFIVAAAETVYLKGLELKNQLVARRAPVNHPQSQNVAITCLPSRPRTRCPSSGLFSPPPSTPRVYR